MASFFACIKSCLAPNYAGRQGEMVVVGCNDVMPASKGARHLLMQDVMRAEFVVLKLQTSFFGESRLNALCRLGVYAAVDADDLAGDI